MSINDFTLGCEVYFSFPWQKRNGDDGDGEQGVEDRRRKRRKKAKRRGEYN